LSKKVTVLINGYGSNEEPSEFEILSRPEIEALLNNLSSSDIYGEAFRQARCLQAFGSVTIYLDVRNGDLVSNWLGSKDFNHPFDSFYEINLCTIKTGCGETELNEDHLLGDSERKEYRQVRRVSYISLEGWIASKYGAEELQDRIELAIDSFATNFKLDNLKIEEQLNNLYASEVIPT